MRIWLATILLLCTCFATAETVKLTDFRVWTAPERTRLVFDLSKTIQHKIFSLPSPNRLVIDLQKTHLKKKVPTVGRNEQLIKKIRHGVRKNHGLRVVLDLSQKVKVQSFLLKPNKQYGHRLVVDIRPTTKVKPVKVVAKTGTIKRSKDIIVAIDAGHGGEDPGAIGKKGTQEKKVTLAIAKKLKQLIDRERGMKAVLVREGDYFIELRERMSIARQKSADLFISIHADAFRKSSVHGSSVYILSQKGASSEAAKWLAERENSADLVGGVKLSKKDDMLAKILMDLSQTATNEISRDVAKKVLKGLKVVGKVHKPQVQHARFQVLKSPDIPSLLVETAFITNKSDERKLNSTRHQLKIAKAVFSGVKSYFYQNPPMGTVMADIRKHTVTSGDTLGSIANQYDVRIASIRRVNRLKGDRILVGKRLLIPTGS